MDTSQSTAARPLLLDTGVTGGFAQHSTLCNENDVTVRELLLELSGQSKHHKKSIEHFISLCCAPLLNFVEGFQLRNRDEDNDGLFAATNVHLTGGRNLKDAKVAFEIRYIVFEVDQSLCNIFFNIIGSGTWSVGGTENLAAD